MMFDQDTAYSNLISFIFFEDCHLHVVDSVVRE